MLGFSLSVGTFFESYHVSLCFPTAFCFDITFFPVFSVGFVDFRIFHANLWPILIHVKKTVLFASLFCVIAIACFYQCDWVKNVLVHFNFSFFLPLWAASMVYGLCAWLCVWCGVAIFSRVFHQRSYRFIVWTSTFENYYRPWLTKKEIKKQMSRFRIYFIHKNRYK